MVIVDEKQFMTYPAPPPYIAAGAVHPPPFPHRREILAFSALPAHLLLKIVYMTFPLTPGVDEGRIERQRKTLYWLSVGLRLVNRAFYVACMHVLRSTYLPAYGSQIRQPYTSDPFPLSAPTPTYTASSTSPSSTDSNTLQSLQRETQVLDLFIALKVREDVWMDDSELHLEREESFKDLFDLMQPRSRMEDLVRHYGVREGVISISSGTSSTSYSPTTPGFFTPSTSASTFVKGKKPEAPSPLPFSALSVSFSTRTVGLQLTSTGRKRTIVQVARTREEKLEYAAKRLVRELQVWLRGSNSVRR